MKPDYLPEENALEAAEHKIRSFLQQGSWRRARDEAKPLCKVDRPRFLPLLVEANIGLIRAMVKKGQRADASQVLEYLKTIAPRDKWLPIEKELGAGLKPSSNVSSLSWASLESLPELEKRKMADRMVTAFQPLEAGAYDSPAIASELLAIQEALTAISAEQYDRAIDLVRPVAHDSIFRNWKLFVKGLAYFHIGDKKRAERFLAEAHPDTAPGRAAIPYLYWLGGINDRAHIQNMSKDVLEVVAQIVAPPEFAPLLARAERLWQQSNPREMYKVLVNGLNNFPSESGDWLGALSEFCMNCLFILPMEKRNEYGMFLDDLLQHHKRRAARETKMILRVLCLAHGYDVVTLPSQWERFIYLCEQLDGANPRFSSLAYEWLGAVLSLDRKAGPSPYPSYYPRPRINMMDPQGAERSLKKSVQLNPDSLSAQLILVTVYDRLKKTSERNRLLDEMTRRFPENKQVLMLAGARCIERKAYAKGLSFLERALEHDRLDPKIPESIANARTLHALDLFRRGRIDEARRTLHSLSQLSVDRQDDFMRGRWTIALRKGILELLYGDETGSGQFLDEARAACPCPEALCLLGYLLWKRYVRQQTSQDPFSQEFRALLRKQASAARVPMLARIIDFWRERAGAETVYDAEKLLRDYLKAAAGRPFSRNEARDLIDSIRDKTLDEICPFIKTILKKDSKDPLFRLYKYINEISSFDSPDVNRKKLNSILQEAASRKDDRAIQLARNELDKLELSNQRPPIPFFADEDEDFEDDDDDDYDDEDDEDDDDDYDDEDDDVDYFEEDLDSMAAEAFSKALNPRELHELEEMLKFASDQDIRRLKKTFSKEIPEEFFNWFVDAVRKGKHKPKAEPVAGTRKPRRKNSNQGDLF
jgi:hypothetical protein